MSKPKKELVIDPEFAAFLSPQTKEELSNLETSLLANGCLDPIKAQTETGIVLDGHTRKRICDKNDIPYEVEWVSVPGGRDGALDWLIQFQMGRRNLSEEQKSYLRGQEYLAKKKAVGKPVVADETYSFGEGDEKTEEKAAGETAEVLAAKYDVSPATINRDAAFAAAVNALPKTEKVAVLTGKSDLTRKDVIAAAKKDKPAKKKKAKKSGAIKFPWSEFDRVLGRLVRATDEIAKSYDSKHSNEHRSALKLLAEYEELILGKEGKDGKRIGGWRQRLEAKEQEK
jgi:hypothetical protein